MTLERKITDLILLIPAEGQQFARKRIDNLIRFVIDGEVPELCWKTINGEIESRNEKIAQTAVNTICKLTDVTWSELKGRDRRRNINDIRHMCMWVIRNSTTLSFQDIGKLFNRHHATILHGVNNINDLITTDHLFRSNFQEILKEINNQSLNHKYNETIKYGVQR